jgi:acyl-CoA dehydrogenase
MIFGQGAIRCHPYAFKEINALMNGDVAGFDRAFWPHIGHVIRNLSRSVLLSVTRGLLLKSPVKGPTAKYYRKISWSSASFALLADIAMGIYGGRLKRMEKITGRFADIFSWMYLGTATLRRFEAEGRRKEHLPFVHWSLQYTLAQIQQAFDGLFHNMGFPFKGPITLWSRANSIGSMPSDKLGREVALGLQKPGAERDALTAGTYIPPDANEALGRLENAFRLVYEADPIAKKVMQAVRFGELAMDRIDRLAMNAIDAGIITQQEAVLLVVAEEARTDAIQVDSFTLTELMDMDQEPERSSVRKVA